LRPASAEPAPELHALVVQKLTRVFGERRGGELLAQILGELRLPAVATADDLERVAEALQARGGFEATTGAMLGVQAAMRRMGV
jgi:hypothetical protein